MPPCDPGQWFARRLPLGCKAQGQAASRRADWWMNFPNDHGTWDAVRAGLDERGFHILPALLGRDECETFSAAYDCDHFRSTIVMARHGYGRGEYKYYRYPLPPLVAELRPKLYERLVPISNEAQQSRSSALCTP